MLRKPRYLYYVLFAGNVKGRCYTRVRNAERDLKREATALAVHRIDTRHGDDVAIVWKTFLGTEGASK